MWIIPAILVTLLFAGLSFAPLLAAGAPDEARVSLPE